MDLHSDLALKEHIIAYFSDLILEWAEYDNFNGRMIEEAMLEALSSNASYYSDQANKIKKLLHEYKSKHDESASKKFKCSAKCDI